MENREVESGFRDPEDKWPDNGYLFRMSHDVSQEAQARNVLSSTWIDQRLARLDRGIPIGYAGAKDYNFDDEENEEPTYNYSFWGEPTPAYNAEYPYNEVHRSESGHVHEIDDTPGHERLNRQHRTGTYEEIDANGSRATKIVGSNYEIVCGDEFVYVKGRTSVTVDGSHHLLVLGDCFREVVGNETVMVRGDKTERIGGNLHQEIGGNSFVSTKGDQRHRTEGNETNETLGFKYHWNQGNTYYGTGGERTDVVSADWNIATSSDFTIGAEGMMHLGAEANMEIQAGDDIDIDGSMVFLMTNGPGVDIIDVDDELERTEPADDEPFTKPVPSAVEDKPQRAGHAWSKTGILDFVRNMFGD